MCTVWALTSSKYPPVVTPSVCHRPPLRKVISLFSSSVSVSQAHASDSVCDASRVQWLWSRWSGGNHGVHSCYTYIRGLPCNTISSPASCSALNEGHMTFHPSPLPSLSLDQLQRTCCWQNLCAALHDSTAVMEYCFSINNDFIWRCLPYLCLYSIISCHFQCRCHVPCSHHLLHCFPFLHTHIHTHRINTTA